MSERKIAGYGWRKQQPDHRDLLFHDHFEVPDEATLPATGGLTPDELPPIWDQGQLGSCVTHGTRRALQTEAMQQKIDMPDVSRLWIYAKGRQLEGTSLREDSGMEVRDGIKVLATLGAPAEKDWPYSDSNPGPFQKSPPKSLNTEALQNVALKYYLISMPDPTMPMRTALVHKQAIAFGFTVPSYFEDTSQWDPASGEPLPLPSDTDQPLGGHCVAVTGYDFSGTKFPRPYFTCDNSWGSGWGVGGRFNIDYEWFKPRPGGALATDLWVVSLVK